MLFNTVLTLQQQVGGGDLFSNEYLNFMYFLLLPLFGAMGYIIKAYGGRVVEYLTPKKEKDTSEVYKDAWLSERENIELFINRLADVEADNEKMRSELKRRDDIIESHDKHIKEQDKIIADLRSCVNALQRENLKIKASFNGVMSKIREVVDNPENFIDTDALEQYLKDVE